VQGEVWDLIKKGILVIWGQHRAGAADELMARYVTNFDGLVRCSIIIDPTVKFDDVRFMARNHNRLLSEGDTNETAADKAHEVRHCADAFNVRALPEEKQKKALKDALQTRASHPSLPWCLSRRWCWCDRSSFTEKGVAVKQLANYEMLFKLGLVSDAAWADFQDILLQHEAAQLEVFEKKLKEDGTVAGFIVKRFPSTLLRTIQSFPPHFVEKILKTWRYVGLPEATTQAASLTSMVELYTVSALIVKAIYPSVILGADAAKLKKGKEFLPPVDRLTVGFVQSKLKLTSDNPAFMSWAYTASPVLTKKLYKIFEANDNVVDIERLVRLNVNGSLVSLLTTALRKKFFKDGLVETVAPSTALLPGFVDPIYSKFQPFVDILLLPDDQDAYIFHSGNDEEWARVPEEVNQVAHFCHGDFLATKKLPPGIAPQSWSMDLPWAGCLPASPNVAWAVDLAPKKMQEWFTHARTLSLGAGVADINLMVWHSYEQLNDVHSALTAAVRHFFSLCLLRFVCKSSYQYELLFAVSPSLLPTQGFSYDIFHWFQNNITNAGGPRMTSALLSCTIATSSKDKSVLFNMADKCSSVRQNVWSTKAVASKFQYEGDTLNVTEKKIICEFQKQRCFTHGGDHGVVGTGSGTEAIACTYNGQNVVCFESDRKQFEGGLARYQKEITKMISEPNYALNTVKDMYLQLQADDIPPLVIATKSPSITPARRGAAAARPLAVRSSLPF
jgi:hypothetical protein